MSTPIDELTIEIDAKAQNANSAIDNLCKKIDVLTTSISKVDVGKLNSLGNGIKRLGDSLQTMKSVDTRSINSVVNKINSLSAIDTSQFATVSANLHQMANGINSLGAVSSNLSKITSFTNGISRFSEIDVSGLRSVASSIPGIVQVFNGIGSVSANAVEFGNLSNNISKLGNKSVQTAITNIPQLATALNGLMTTLSKAPKVSQNLIDMTNALANLTAQGSKVGSASNSIVKGLNRASSSATRANKSFKGLASVFGRFYANCFLIIRGLKSLWNSINSTADYLEAFNYFEVALNKVGGDWAGDWEKYSEKLGVTSAEEYANSFKTRLNESLKGLSGVQISIDANGKTGLLTDTGMKNLGLNIQEVTQYASQLASVTNSVGQTGEVTLATASAFTKLGADMSSLFNVDYSSVMNNLQSGLIGQSRALYKYGIDITNATLQTYAYGLGVEKAVSEMTQAEKMQLRMIAILDQSRVSWGDQANTINSLSNSIRQFKNNISEAGQILGQLFVPILSKVMPIINGVVIAIKRLMVNVAGLLGIKLDLSEFGQGTSDITDDMDGLGDSLDGIAESAKKAKAGIRGFDELNIIGSTSDFGTDASGIVGNIDLTQQILNATAEYEKAWQEAYDKMQNRAEEFADKITKVLNFGDLSNDIADIAESIKNLYSAFVPFIGGVFSGFTETTFKAFKTVSDFAGYISENADPVVMSAFGEALGKIVASILMYKGVSSVASSLISGIKGIAAALTANPILGTFTLASGIVALLTMTVSGAEAKKRKKETEEKFADVIEVIETVAEKTEELKEKGGEAKKALEENLSKTDELQKAFGDWEAIASKPVETLTEEEKTLLELYTERLLEILPDAASIIHDQALAYGEVISQVEALMEVEKKRLKLQSYKDYLSTSYDAEVELEFNLQKAQEALEDALSEYAKNLGGVPKDIAEQLLLQSIGVVDEIEGVWGRMGEIHYMQDGIEQVFTYNSDQLKQMQSDMKAYADAYEEVEKAQSALKEQQKETAWALEELSKAQEKTAETSEKLGESTKTASEKTKESTKITEKNIAGIAEQNKKLKELYKTLEGISGKEFSTEIKIKSKILDPYEVFKAVGSKVPNVNITRYSVGGFPEDGLFMANHSELVGKFSNGKTAVANNEQITKGIEEAAYRGMMRALQGTNFGNKATFEVVGDPNGMFKVVQKQANQYTKSTGRNAFA